MMNNINGINLVFMTIIITFSSLFSLPSEAGTRGRYNSVLKTQYAITCRNLKRKHARLEEIYKYGGESALRQALNDPKYWVSSSEIDTWKKCRTEPWYRYL